MNVIDIVILGIIALSVLVGLYRGFIASVASVGGCVASLGLSFWLSPRLVEWISSRPDVMQTLMSYTDANTRIGDQTMAALNVANLTSEQIASVVERVHLPAPLDQLLLTNLKNQVFRSTDVTQVGGYVAQTVIGAVVSVIAFILCFIVCMLVLHFVLNFLKEVFRFPVLKQLNTVAGGVFGLLRGVLLCFVAFALLPLIQTIIPISGMDALIAGSSLAPVFNSSHLILAIMNGRL